MFQEEIDGSKEIRHLCWILVSAPTTQQSMPAAQGDDYR